MSGVEIEIREGTAIPPIFVSANPIGLRQQSALRLNWALVETANCIRHPNRPEAADQFDDKDPGELLQLVPAQPCTWSYSWPHCRRLDKLPCIALVFLCTGKSLLLQCTWRK
ncbi:hypothetical protein M0R45_012599 [Rubus argutus]|uniref:Uncharacterized protein n=1 Tax=Rubus argutus TaxID=59490 RepID=A0AAW1YD57_RUBAR